MWRFRQLRSPQPIAGGEIGILARVMQVDNEAGQDSRRRRGHEDFGRVPFAGGGRQMREIALERNTVLVA